MSFQNGGYNDNSYQHQNSHGGPPFHRRGGGRYHSRPIPEENNQEPCHTVFFFNIVFNISSDEFKKFAEKYGEVKTIYEKKEKGFFFVTYYDIRSAEKAMKEAPSEQLDGRPVRTNYAYKAENPKKDPLCATILITFPSPVDNVSEDDVRNAIEPFGEIRQIRKEDNNFVVKFYDLRCASAAAEHAEPVLIAGHECKIELKYGEDDGLIQENTYERPPRNERYGEKKFFKGGRGGKFDRNHNQYNNNAPLPNGYPNYNYPYPPPPAYGAPPQYPYVPPQYPQYPYPQQQSYAPPTQTPQYGQAPPPPPPPPNGQPNAPQTYAPPPTQPAYAPPPPVQQPPAQTMPQYAPPPGVAPPAYAPPPPPAAQPSTIPPPAPNTAKLAELLG